MKIHTSHAQHRSTANNNNNKAANLNRPASQFHSDGYRGFYINHYNRHNGHETREDHDTEHPKTNCPRLDRLLY